MKLGAVLQGDRDAGIVLLDALEEDAGLEGDLALAEGPLHQLGDPRVLERDQRRQRLDDGDLGAERRPDGGELDADDAAAEHDRLLRDPLQAQRLGGGDDPALDRQAGQRPGVGTGGQDDVLADVAVAADHDGVRADELALTLDGGDAAGLDQAGQALVQPVDDAVLVLEQRRHVDAVEAWSSRRWTALAGLVGDLGGVQQGLGRDAAPVQAGPADLVLLDQHDRRTQLGGADGGGVTAGPPAENHQVDVGIGHR